LHRAVSVFHRATATSLLLLLIALAPREAVAQQENAAAAMPSSDQAQPTEEVVVKGATRSPQWTQGRTWGATRFWLLDPGEQEVEAWYSARIKHNGVAGDNEHLWQLEYMTGVTPHVQLDVYFNYALDNSGPHIEGAQIEGRFSLGRHYGDVWANPALYVEWHPQTRGANRGELRLLLGGQLGSPRLYGAINPYLEQNIDEGADGAFVADREMGASAAMGYAMIPGRLSLGAEVKAGVDQQGGTTYQGVALAGPAVWLTTLSGHLRFTFTALYGMTRRSDAYYPIFVLAVHP
jgi:hypothetical protein